MERYFHYSAIGGLLDNIQIKGSKTVLEKFNEIDEVKLDFDEPLENIEFSGFTDKDEIILKFTSEPPTSASGVYDFTRDFFEDLFHMGKFAMYCIEKDYHDLIRENLLELFKKNKAIKKQYRILNKNDKYYLRGITSDTRYNNYDNHIAIYIVFHALNRLAVAKNLVYSVVEAYLSDSGIKIFFELENPFYILGVGNLYFGALLSNNEIKDGKLLFEIRYRIENLEQNISFSAMPELKDAVVGIFHSAGISTLQNKLENLYTIEKLHDSMINYIKELRTINMLSADALHKLISTITYSRDFKPDSKQKFQEMYDKNLIDNTMTLIEAFNRINQMTSDIDEKIHLERIYYGIIKDLVDRKKN